MADPPSGDEDLERQSGLGRGLAAVLEQQAPRSRPGRGIAALLGDAPEEAPALDPLLLHDVAGAVLAGLEQSLTPDLCAYVHDPGDRPTLHLRTPPLGELTPDAAFWLFGELRGRLHGLAEEPLDAAGYRGLTVRIAGDGTAGLFVVARRPQFSDAEHSAVRAYCETFGKALHHPLIIEAGAETRPADAGSAEVIVRAVLREEDPRLAFRYVGTRTEGDRHIALVLVEGPSNRAVLAQASGESRAAAVTAATEGAASVR